MRYKFLLFKPLSLWYFVMVAQTKAMVFFSSVNIFIMVILKSLTDKSDIWLLSQAISVAYFFPPNVWGILSCLFKCFMIFFVGNWTV